MILPRSTTSVVATAVGLRLATSVTACCEEFGEDPAHDGAEEGKTGADDGYVGFGCCPVGGADVVVCMLVRVW